MPRFTTSLPKQAAHQGFDLKRTPSALTGIVTSDNFLCVDTHYWHGRTLPCERIVNDDGTTFDDSPCQACQAKQGFRTHVYLAAINPKTREHYIFECTANAAKAFEEYQATAGHLQGCAFQASRPKGGPNSKVVIVTNTANLARVSLPPPPDLIRALAVIWRLPVEALPVVEETVQPLKDATGHPTKQSTIRPAAATLDQMRDQPDDADPEANFINRRDQLTGDLLAASSNGKRSRKL
jgi:hypothetical protein